MVVEAQECVTTRFSKLLHTLTRDSHMFATLPPPCACRCMGSEITITSPADNYIPATNLTNLQRQLSSRNSPAAPPLPSP